MRTSSYPKEPDLGVTENPTNLARIDPGFPIEQGTGGQGTGGGNPAKPPNQAVGEPSSPSVSPKKSGRRTRRGAVSKKTSRARKSA